MKRTKRRSFAEAMFDGKDPRHCIVWEFPSHLLGQLSLEEQNLFITFGLAANELSMLVRVISISTGQEHQGLIYDAYADSQYLALLKLYAGKIHECWELIRGRYFRTKLSATYDPRLSPDAAEALTALKRYFGRGKNVVSLLRNEGAFHYTRESVNNAIASVPRCRMFVSGRAFYDQL